MDTLRPIQGLWIGEQLSEIEQLCIRSFLKNGHAFHLYTYGPVKNIPKGTDIKDANAILSNDNIFRTKKHNSLAIFADWFRWKLLYEKGGWWVDMDVICLKPFTFDKQIINCGEKDDMASIGVMYYPMKHPATKLMLNSVEKPSKFLECDSNRTRMKKLFTWSWHSSDWLRKNTPWGAISGPTVMTRVIRHLHMDHTILPSETFYPIHYRNWRDIFKRDNPKQEFPSNSYAVHLWNECFKNEIDKDASFPKGSIIEALSNLYK